MTEKEARVWLKSLHSLDKRINALIVKRDQLGGYRSPKFSEMPKTVSPNIRANENTYLKIAELSIRIDKYIDKRYDELQRIMAAIDKMESHLYSSVLINRYINYFSWKKVGELVGYDPDHVRKEIEPKAINEFIKRYP